MAITAPKRKSGPRSVSGCRTCRSRRVKCDEERPQCVACARLRLLCRYDKSADTKPSSDTMAQLPVALYQLPFKAPGAPAERKALHYFFVHASVELSTYLALGFWDGWLLQLCQTNTTVQQAVIALSRAHLERSKRSLPLPPQSKDQREPSPNQSLGRQLQSGNPDYFYASSETLEAYQRAVRRVIYSMRKQPRPPHSVVLTCCILLYTFSNLVGDPGHAEVHLSNGVQIFQEMLDGKSTIGSSSSGKRLTHSTEEELNALLPVIARLDLELAHYSQGDMWLVLDDDAYNIVEQRDFENVQEASLSLNRLFRALKKLLEQVKSFAKRTVFTAPQAVIASQAQLTRAFEDWNMRIGKYERERPSLETITQQTPSIKLRARLLEALSVQVLKTDFLLIKQSLDALVHDFPFTRQDRPLQPAGSRSAALLAATRRALELQVAYKKASGLPLSHQVAAHWSIFDTLAILSVESETRESALAVSREFSPLVSGLNTRSPAAKEDG